MCTELQMSTISRGLTILVNIGNAGFRQMTATYELVVDEAGTPTGRTILLFADRRHLVLHHLGVAGLQAVAAGDEDVHVLQVAGAAALRTIKCWIPGNHSIFQDVFLGFASPHWFLGGET